MSLARILCDVCGKAATHRSARVRMTQDTYLFDCPTCRELRVKQMGDHERALLLLGGAYPAVSEPTLLAFLTCLQDRDYLAASVLHEVTA